MPWTQADIDRIRAVIAAGAKSIGFSDQVVSYQNTEDLLRVLREMETSVALTTTPGAGCWIRARYVATSKGC